MTDSTILDLLVRLAGVTPRAPAIEALGSAPLGRGGLLELVERGGAALANLGCGPGTRIATVLTGGAATATAHLTIAAHATCVPLNPDLTRAELGRLLRQLDVELLVAAPAAEHAVAAAGELRIPVVRHVPAGPARPAGDFDLVGRAAARRGSHDAARAAQALVLHTSGSTALPKVVPLTHRNLLVSAANVARSLALTAEDRCLAALPQYHVGALVDLLLAPLAVGGAVIVAPDIGTERFFECVAALRPSWYQAVPTMLRDLLHRAEVDGRDTRDTGLRFVRAVSAPLPPDLLRTFEERFSVPVIEIYGMTETAGVITSNPLPPGERKPGSVGLPAGPEVAVVDAAGNRVESGLVGEVLVRGPNVMAGYEGPNGVADASFVGAWLRTGDAGFLDGDGYLHLTGRIKEFVNRGGEKIAPREIDEVVLGHPAVRDAAAFAISHATLGEDVALAVVLHEGRDVEAAELRAFCAERLAWFKVPQRIEIVDALPRTAGGKLLRRALSAAHDGCAADMRPARAPRSDAPTTPTERLVARMWERALGRRGIGLGDDFFDLGGDSLKAVTFVAELRRRLGIELPVAAVYDHPTISALAPCVDTAERIGDRGTEAQADLDATLAELREFLAGWTGRRPDDSVLVGRNTLGSRLPFFWCVQGGNEFVVVADALGADQPVYGMRSLFGMRQKSPARARALARHYAREIEAIQPDGPVRVGGYCAGGGIALEVARALLARGRAVGLLCLLEHYTPLPYPGRLVLFHCRTSEFQEYADPRSDWRRFYTGPISRHAMDASHDECFAPAELERFAARLRRELDESADGRHALTLAPDVGPLPAGAHRARLRTSVPRVAAAGSVLTLDVAVQNRSPVAWPRSTVDGVAVACSLWRRQPGERRHRGGIDGAALLDEPLAPGATTTVRLRCRVPRRLGLCRLDIDLVELFGEVRWFAELGSVAFRRSLVVVPPTGALQKLARTSSTTSA